MDAKKEFLMNLAVSLSERGQVMAVPILAVNLNNNGFRTSYGDLYEGLRGTYTLIRATYHYLMNQGFQDEADMVAGAFVKPNGDYAY